MQTSHPQKYTVLYCVFEISYKWVMIELYVCTQVVLGGVLEVTPYKMDVREKLVRWAWAHRGTFGCCAMTAGQVCR